MTTHAPTVGPAPEPPPPGAGSGGDHPVTPRCVRPILFEPAYADRDAVWDMVLARAPYYYWEATDGAAPIATLRRDQIRVSLVWRAVALADERAARVLDEHEDDLDLETVLSVFAADLAARGIAVPDPAETLTGEAWTKVIAGTYLPRFA